jgi:hypothetical protein
VLPPIVEQTNKTAYEQTIKLLDNVTRAPAWAKLAW